MTSWSFRDCLWAALGRWSAFKDSCRRRPWQQAEVVHTGNFANGVYVLRVANNQGLTFKQVLIQH